MRDAPTPRTSGPEAEERLEIQEDPSRALGLAATVDAAHAPVAEAGGVTFIAPADPSAFLAWVDRERQKLLDALCRDFLYHFGYGP